MQTENTKPQNQYPAPIVVWELPAEGLKLAAQQLAADRIGFYAYNLTGKDIHGVIDAWNGPEITAAVYYATRNHYYEDKLSWIEQRELSTAAREQNPNPERSLSDAISYPDRIQIDDETRAKLVALLTKRCRRPTVRAIDRALKHPADLKNCGLFGRLEIAPTVSYCAGQDYPSEIATLRKLLINN